jgi:hypothetical protein
MRWVNQSQPQTLYGANMLAYFRAVVILLFGASAPYRLLMVDVFDNIGLGEFAWDITAILLAFGMAIGGLGVANEKKWGFRVLTVSAIYAVAATVWWMYRAEQWTELGNLLRLMFDGVLVVLLFHPMTQEYRKIWFS